MQSHSVLPSPRDQWNHYNNGISLNRHVLLLCNLIRELPKSLHHNGIFAVTYFVKTGFDISIRIYQILFLFIENK